MLSENQTINIGDRFRHRDGTVTAIVADTDGVLMGCEIGGTWRMRLASSYAVQRFRAVHSLIEPEPGRKAYEERRDIHALGGSRLPLWDDMLQSERDTWERCAAPAPEPAHPDSNERFSAQAHAFAVKSGEDRELIKVLIRRLLRELDGGA